MHIYVNNITYMCYSNSCFVDPCIHYLFLVKSITTFRMEIEQAAMIEPRLGHCVPQIRFYVSDNAKATFCFTCCAGKGRNILCSVAKLGNNKGSSLSLQNCACKSSGDFTLLLCNKRICTSSVLRIDKSTSLS